MINWFTLIKKLMQTSIVIVSGSIINASTVHASEWHLTPHMTLSIENCIRRTPCNRCNIIKRYSSWYCLLGIPSCCLLILMFSSVCLFVFSGKRPQAIYGWLWRNYEHEQCPSKGKQNFYLYYFFLKMYKGHYWF